MNTENTVSSMEAYESALVSSSWVSIVAMSAALIWTAAAVFVFHSISWAQNSLLVLLIDPGFVMIRPVFALPKEKRTGLTRMLVNVIVFTPLVLLLVFAKVHFAWSQGTYTLILISFIIVFQALNMYFISRVKKMHPEKQWKWTDERVNKIMKNAIFAGLIGFVVVIASLLPILSAFPEWLSRNRGALMLIYWAGFSCTLLTRSIAFLIMYKRGE